MGRLINSTTMTVDGVTDVADWYVSEGGHNQAARDRFVGAAGMVLGRKTYEGLAAYWTQETGPWADLINPMQKFVASRTLSGASGFIPRSGARGRGPIRARRSGCACSIRPPTNSGVTLLRYEPV